MAPPPKYLIERRLIRQMVKKVVPQRPLIPTEYFTKLLQCWKKFGTGSAKCGDEEMMFDFANTQLITFQDRMKEFGLKEIVMAEMKRPLYPRETKGRFYGQKKKFEDVIKFMTDI